MLKQIFMTHKIKTITDIFFEYLFILIYESIGKKILISSKIEKEIIQPVKSNIKALELKLYDNSGRKISIKEIVIPIIMKTKPIFSSLILICDILFFKNAPPYRVKSFLLYARTFCQLPTLTI